MHQTQEQAEIMYYRWVRVWTEFENDNMCGLGRNQVVKFRNEASHKSSSEVRADKSMSTWEAISLELGVNPEGNSS